MLWKIYCTFNSNGRGVQSRKCTSKKQMQILILKVVFPLQYSSSLPICFQIVLLWQYIWIYFMNHIFFRFLCFVSNLTYTFYVFIPLCNLQFAFYQSILQPVSPKVTATRDLVNLIGALYICLLCSLSMALKIPRRNFVTKEPIQFLRICVCPTGPSSC